MTDAGPTSAAPAIAGEPRARSRGAAGQLASLWRALRHLEGRRLWIGLALLVLGTLSEGAAIVTFLPVLQLVGAGTTSIDLSGLDFPGAGLLPAMVPLGALLLVIVGLTALQAIFNRSKAVYLSDLVHDFTNHHRTALFREVALARWAHVARIPRTRIEHALTGEIERLYLAAFLVLSILQNLVGLALYFVLSLAISAPMTLLSYGFGVVALMLMRPFRRLARHYGDRLQGRREGQLAAVSEFVGSLKMARSMNLEDRYLGLFSAILGQTKADARQFIRQSSIGAGLFQFAVVSGAALFIWVALAWAQLDVARIVILLLLFMRTAPRFMGIQGSVQQLLVDLPAWGAISRLRDDLQAERDPAMAGRDPAPVPRRDIRLDRVSWRFPGESREAVSDCSLTLRAGELTVLVGPSGAGKSTLADIVMGLLEPRTGAVLVDGESLRPGQFRNWRDRTGYVAQEPFMINGTIRDNMAIAAAGPVDDERIFRALDLASAGFVRDLPAGLDTMMGDRGTLLSGGERQRIAVARALLREPDVLVLDEATSALDWENEEALIRAIDGLRGRMTILAITHRPALIRVADAVFVMESGRVTASERPREQGLQAESYLGRMTS
jgi:ATP-binding cassette subfamily C protein